MATAINRHSSAKERIEYLAECIAYSGGVDFGVYYAQIRIIARMERDPVHRIAMRVSRRAKELAR